MSTVANWALEADTASANQHNEANTYRYGRQETDLPDSPCARTDLSDSPYAKEPRSPRLVIFTNVEQREKIIQKWSGTVIDCSDDELTARLEDLTNPANPDEIVVLSTEEIESRDHALIQRGAVFLWQIGYRYGPKYPRERFSKIRFRRLPKWTKEEIQHAEKLAEEYANFFRADPTYTS